MLSENNEGSASLTNQTREAEKRLRGVIGTWHAFDMIKKQFPKAAVLLMDSSASFDVLVIDPEQGTLVAVEVKAPRSSSKSARHLTDAQFNLRHAIQSRDNWKFLHKKCVVYDKPVTGFQAKFVD